MGGWGEGYPCGCPMWDPMWDTTWVPYVGRSPCTQTPLRLLPPACDEFAWQECMTCSAVIGKKRPGCDRKALEKTLDESQEEREKHEVIIFSITSTHSRSYALPADPLTLIPPKPSKSRSRLQVHNGLCIEGSSRKFQLNS